MARFPKLKVAPLGHSEDVFSFIKRVRDEIYRARQDKSITVSDDHLIDLEGDLLKHADNPANLQAEAAKWVTVQ